MPGWKSVQDKRQEIKKTKLALFALAIILVLIVLSQIVKFTQMLFSPWRLSSPVHRNYMWNGDFNINILLVSKKITLLSLNVQNQKITITTLPNETYLEVPHGFGKWQLSSVVSLGGEELLKDSLTEFFAVPIDGVLSCSCELLSTMRKNPFGLLLLLPSLKADLSPFELIRLNLAISSVRFDKVKEVDLEKIGLLEKDKLLDGTSVFVADPTRLDSFSSELAEPIIKSEHKTIAVFNSTNQPSLAQEAARLITNIGGDVIIVSNSQRREKTEIFGEKSKTLEKLKQIFDMSGKINLKKESLGSSRAQINVFLGEDFLKKMD